MKQFAAPLPSKSYLFTVESVGKEPRLMVWDHVSKELAQAEMERKGYRIIKYLGRGC